MKNISFSDRTQDRSQNWKLGLIVLTMLALVSWLGTPFCVAQNTITGAPETNRLVPDLQKRPAPNPLERRSLIQRPENDQDSIASLVRNTQGEDSLIEVIVGRGKLITLEKALITGESSSTPIVAVGDPTVLDFDILPNARMIRILGKRVGVTDLSVVTGDGKAYTFEVRVVFDMMLLRAYLRQMFPSGLAPGANVRTRHRRGRGLQHRPILPDH